jgi:hypothetical protein
MLRFGLRALGLQRWWRRSAGPAGLENTLHLTDRGKM